MFASVLCLRLASECNYLYAVFLLLILLITFRKSFTFMAWKDERPILLFP